MRDKKRNPVYRINPNDFFKNGEDCDVFERLTEKQNKRYLSDDYQRDYEKEAMIWNKINNQVVGAEVY